MAFFSFIAPSLSLLLHKYTLIYTYYDQTRVDIRHAECMYILMQGEWG